MKEDRLQVFFSLVKLILVLLIGFFLANFIAFAVAMPFANFDIELITNLLQNPIDYPETRTALMVMQGVAALCIFIITPLIYIAFIDKDLTTNQLFQKKAFPTALILGVLTLVIAVIEMPWVGWLGQWNNEWVFPEVFEIWARAQEDKMKEITIFLTEFRTFEQFLLGFIVIAILPGIGEELLFRGLLQNKFKQLFGNVHIAIWVTAIIFSAIHLQFYGFAPRMLLGAVFGYLYHWSGNLLYPMLAHFVNNGFTVLMMYLYQQQQVDIDIDAEVIPLDSGLVSLGISLILLFLFHKISDNLRIEKV